MNISQVKCFSLEKLKPRAIEPHDFPSRKLKLSDIRLKSSIQFSNIVKFLPSKPINLALPRKDSTSLRRREISNHIFFSPSITRLKERSRELSSPFTTLSNKSTMKIEAPAIKALSLFPVLKPRVNTRLKLRYFN